MTWGETYCMVIDINNECSSYRYGLDELDAIKYLKG